MEDDLVRRQQREIALLRERIRQLEEALVPTDIVAPLEWCLTGAEARLFAFLTTREMATKQAIMNALYSGRAGDEPEIKIVDVFVCKLRKKIEPFGVDIQTVWGQGYRLAGREQWRKAA